MKNEKQINTEQYIISLLRQKDQQGIELLYQNYSVNVFGIICRIIELEDIAQIVLQDTFMKTWEKIDYYDETRGSLYTWMINIARNSAIDMLRSKNYKQSLKLIALENVSTTAYIQKIDPLEYMDMKELVARLDPKPRQVIELIYFAGFSRKEVAQDLNIPLGTVKSRVRKAFQDLRNIVTI